MASQGGSVAGRLLKLVAVVVVVVLVLLGASQVPGIIGDQVSRALSAVNPFGTTTTDRTGAPVLISLEELSEFRAASAYLEVVVDVEEDTGFVPDFISGERVIYVGKGTVDAYVDFSDLDEDRVVVSEDGESVTVTLPAPRVAEPALDLQESYVADADAGLVERFSGSELEREAQLEAADRLGQVAGEATCSRWRSPARPTRSRRCSTRSASPRSSWSSTSRDRAWTTEPSVTRVAT